MGKEGTGSISIHIKLKDMFCYIAAARTHVNLGFCCGASLSDPNHVLEGEGKRMRHVKFWNERDVQRPFVRRYIRAAIEQIEQPLNGLHPQKPMDRDVLRKR